jgi:23S rRNA pseudouridine2605 synthase
MGELIRLNKYLAHTLGMSRREADNAIEAGRAIVNGKPAILGTVVQPGRDSIQLSGEKIRDVKKRYTYLLLNKPVGYVCSRKQQGDNPTIYDLLPRQYRILKVAGRLDKDSCGLLLLTDDGDTIFKLTHPKFAKKKVYHVGLNKPLTSEDEARIEKGVKLEDGVSSFQISDLSSLRKQGSLKPPIQAKNDKLPNTYKITMHEGRNRQIRRTFKALGYTVTHLQRTQVGPLKLNDLAPGKSQTHHKVIT